MISDFTDCFNVCAHTSNITAQRNTAKQTQRNSARQTQRNTGFNTRDFDRLNKTRSYFCCSPLALSCFEINIFPSFPSFIRQSVQIYSASANPAIVSATKGIQKPNSTWTLPYACSFFKNTRSLHEVQQKG